MRAREFLLEAKPETLGQGMLAKLFATYQSKPDVREFNFSQPIEVANEIFRHVGPNYLIWTSKQYTQDRYFFLHDLPAWREILTQFADLSKDRRIQIERDINRYQNIDQLRDVINNLTQKKTELGSKFYSKAISAIDSFVKNGQATWLYRSNEYSIYYPKTWESSNICSKLMSTTVCTIMNKGHFESYREYGTLMYIITQDKLYNCFISKNPLRQKSEFADEQNNHRYNLEWMLNQFPALDPLVKKAVGPDTEPPIKQKFGIEVTDKELIRYVSEHPLYIRSIENPSEEVQLAAVKQNGEVIQFIGNPSEEVKLAAVRSDGFIIRHIENPSEEVKLAAVRQNGNAINWIENPSEEVKLAAVSQDGLTIKGIKNPSEEVKLAAIKQNGNAINWIENPSEEMQLAAIKQNGNAIKWIKNPSIELQWAAIRQNGRAITHIENPSEEMKLAAVRESGYSIYYIKNPSEEIQLAAVSQDGLTIKGIKNPSEEVKLAAIKQNGRAIAHIENPSEEMKLAAVRESGYSIYYIKNPSEEIQLAAVRQNASAIRYIKNPTDKVKALSDKVKNI